MKSYKNCVLALLPMVLLGMAMEANAQAGNVVCTKCVDPSDIANGAVNTAKLDNGAVATSRLDNQSVNAQKLAKNAVTSSKIKKGSVTLSKVVPKLKNAIGTACEPGKVVVGKDNNGNLVCENPAPGYFPYGPQVDVHQSELNEWNECYSDLYNNAGTSIDGILQACNGNYLLLACRPVGDTRYTLLAAGNRNAILTDTGNASNGETTLDNGTEWYFNDLRSWGFAGEGDPVTKSTCDTNGTGDTDQRLCWHASAGNISGGYRCGTNFLNGNATWERKIFQVGGVPLPD